MTILEAIKRLQEIHDLFNKDYSDMEVKIDCPDCGKTFSPSRIVVETHIVPK